jgi:2,4-dienoyl-CoA reductase (NADPH2)
VHKLALERDRVEMLGDVTYERVSDEGLHIRVGDKPRLLALDNIIVCAGQESMRTLVRADAKGRPQDPRFHVIGGALVAGELDAKRAIREGVELGARL